MTDNVAHVGGTTSRVLIEREDRIVINISNISQQRSV